MPPCPMVPEPCRRLGKGGELAQVLQRRTSPWRGRQQGADIAVEGLIGPPAGMSITPENSSSSWPSFGERFKPTARTNSDLDKTWGQGHARRSAFPCEA